ncbi:ecto-ADP-ribosyltransferase 5-like isoform X2 [Phascolarctos cinereus]
MVYTCGFIHVRERMCIQLVERMIKAAVSPGSDPVLPEYQKTERAEEEDEAKFVNDKKGFQKTKRKEDKKRQEDLKMNCKWKIIITTVIVVMIIGIIGLVIYELKVGFKKIYMSLEPNAFDDQYMGCEMDMMKKAKELLAEERKIDPQLNDVWEKAEKTRKNLPLDLNGKSIGEPFEISVIAYTDYEIPFYRKFNNKVRTCCTSKDDYMKSFQFKAFHFYLTRAIQLLGGVCTPVYRGINLKIYPDQTREMRFGQFASSSKDINVARHYAKGSGTLYTFTTCLGASIQHLSYNKSEKEVLIPPYQVFSVSAFESNIRGLSTVHLEDKTTYSNFNCAYLEGEKKDSSTSNSGIS